MEGQCDCANIQREGGHRVGWGIAPMGGAKRAPLILANIELCGSIWRSNDSLQHTKDLSTDEDVLI